MTDTDTHPLLNAPSVAADARSSTAAARAEKPHIVAGSARGGRQADAAPISPIVLAGFVRMAEFLLVVLVGLAIYAAYIPAEDRLVLALSARDLSPSPGCRCFAFQTADIYQVQAFRGHEKQYMRLASAWSMVFLIVIGVSFFAKMGEIFSRVWLGAFYVAGLVTLIASRRILFLLVRQWTNEGRLTRRTVIVGGGDAGAHVIEELQSPEGRRRQDHRPVRRSRRRALSAPTAPDSASSAPSTIWSSSRAARASIW